VNGAVVRSAAIALVVLCAALPILLQAIGERQVYWLFVVSEFYVFAIVAISLDLLMGRSGQISLGQSGFVALGAYTTAILNQRFEETGEIPVEEWNRLVAVTDEERHPIPPENWPMRVARLQRRPISRRIWLRRGGSEWRHLQVTAVPLVGEGEEMLGVMNIFWEI